ncbi:KAT8 regulatory NSL complex subunit 3-like [Metopolophium dirhodum]|uniref:KAT8 regulatory NSL complex subunit 3-like n=1 Tax=Metopolophium dirhodum TaxID=44670 RepID=UPI00298F7739|nr:KAT8 regulatory NSL complex subunit 3-like [Metopolophium dirhodum]
MDSDVDSELKSDFTSYLQHISQRKKYQQNTSTEHSYSSAEYQQDNLCSTIQTLFIHRFVQNEISTDDIDIETIDKDEKLLTYRPDVEAKSIEPYRNSKLPRDPEMWEDNINKQRWNKLERTLFERALSILYSNRLSRLTYEGTVQEYVQKIICTEKSVAEMHHLLTNYTHWDISLMQWLHRLFISNLPDDYLASYIDILEKLKQIAPLFINDMISANSIGCFKEEIKSKSINLDEPVDPFNLMLTTYPPLKLPKNPVIILVPDFPGYCTQPNTRTYDWMNALSYLAKLDVALAVKVPWDYEEYSREEEVDIETSLEAMVDATRSKVVSVRFEDPSRPIILAGVGVSAAIACQVAVLENVEGLVCLGFFVNSSEVKRGYEGDCILGLECPTVFVTGQLSIFSPVLDMEELRVKLKCKTNHILVGGANDELVMNHTTKMREAVTQKLVDRCVLEEIGNFLKDILEPTTKIICTPDVENRDFKKPVFSKNKPNNTFYFKICKPLAHLNKGNKKRMVPPNKQTIQRQTANRKTIKTPSSSMGSKVIINDKELIPAPSCSLRQEYKNIQCENANSTINSIQKQEELFIPKLGNQKFSNLTELSQKEDNFNINVSQTTSSLTFMNGSPVMFTPDQKNIVACSSNFQSLHNQTAAPVMEEITPDQILNMPIVFADEPQEKEEVKHSVDNSSDFIENLNEQKMIVKEKSVDEHFDVLCPTISRTPIPKRLKIKQVAYDSPSKVKLVVNRAPKGLVPCGYQICTVPSQNSGNIQLVNRLPILGNKIRRIERELNSEVVPKIVTIRNIQDGNIKTIKSITRQQIHLNKIKTLATTQKLKKII